MKKLSIISTTDIHGFLTCSNDEKQGLLSLPNLTKQIGEALLIDNGDYLVGSPLATFFNMTEKISPLIHLANQLGIDIMVPGNHDFDWGLAFLKRQVAAFNGVYLCANVVDTKDDLIFEPYKIIEKNGFKVGVIGVITGAMPQIAPYQKIKELKFIDVLETLAYWIPIVLSKADILLVSYHGGIERDMVTNQPTQYDTGEDQLYKIITSFPEIAGVIAGHQHRENVGCYKATDTLYVQPGYRGNVFGLFEFIEKNNQISKQAQLLSSKNYSASSFDYDQKRYQQWLEQPIDLTKFLTYIKSRIKVDHYLFQIQQSTIAGFLASFTIPYRISVYHLSKAEWQHFVSQFPLKDEQIIFEASSIEKEDYQIVTNCHHLPFYRLEANYVYDIFDEYLCYLKSIETGEEK